MAANDSIQTLATPFGFWGGPFSGVASLKLGKIIVVFATQVSDLSDVRDH